MPLYVRDVMVPAESVRGDQPLQVALNLMAESSYDQIPVTEGDDGPLIGVISYRFLSEDRISYQFGPIPGEPTRDSMRPRSRMPEQMVSEGGNEVVDDELLRYYYKNDFILVVDSQGCVSGIAQLWDVANGLLHHAPDEGP